jgi:hypothetical protein
MTIFELGALGEFISAVIIVVTLIYIANQSRQNQKLLQSNSFQARANPLIDIYKSMALSNEFADISVRHENGLELTEAESKQLSYLYQAYFKQSENGHFQMEIGVMKGDPESFFAALGAQLKANSLFREVYIKTRTQYRKPFTDFLDGYLPEAGD